MRILVAGGSGAERVVATHGAALANLAWTPRGRADVIEIARAGQPRCFGRLAALLDLPYQRIDAAADGHWIVDLETLAAAIERDAHTAQP